MFLCNVCCGVNTDVGILWWQCHRVITAGRRLWLQVAASWHQHKICTYVVVFLTCAFLHVHR